MYSQSVAEDHCNSPNVKVMVWRSACKFVVCLFVFSFYFFTFIPACDCSCSGLSDKQWMNQMLWRWGQLWSGLFYLSYSKLQRPAAFYGPDQIMPWMKDNVNHFWYCWKPPLRSSFSYVCGNCYVLVNKTSVLECAAMCLSLQQKLHALLHHVHHQHTRWLMNHWMTAFRKSHGYTVNKVIETWFMGCFLLLMDNNSAHQELTAIIVDKCCSKDVTMSITFRSALWSFTLMLTTDKLGMNIEVFLLQTYSSFNLKADALSHLSVWCIRLVTWFQ